MRDTVYFCNMATVAFFFFSYTLPFHYLCNFNTLPLMMISSRSATVLSLTLFWQRWDRAVWWIEADPLIPVQLQFSTVRQEHDTEQATEVADILLSVISWHCCSATDAFFISTQTKCTLPAHQLILWIGCVPSNVFLYKHFRLLVHSWTDHSISLYLTTAVNC